jgi:hypothetical protein
MDQGATSFDRTWYLGRTSARGTILGLIVAVAPLREDMRVNNQVEIDLELARVSDSALAMLEGVNGGATSLPQGLWNSLLDALAEEHLRRFGAPVNAAVMLRVPMRTLDPDELWHSLRLLGNWLSYADAASRNDPDLEAAAEVIARMWMGMHVALNFVMDGPHDHGCWLSNN